MPDTSVSLFALAAVLAYVYAFVGGFTDAANAIATSVGSRVLTERQAVAMAALLNLLGGLTGTAVAATIGKGLVAPDSLTLLTVIAAIAGAMSWSLLTYFRGIPVSETHGLVGGLIGAALATGGPETVQWKGLTKTLVAIVASPTLGLLGGFLVLAAVYWTFRRLHRGPGLRLFQHLQRLSAAYMAFSHGRNDAQKPMGVLALALALHAGSRDVSVPTWIVISCAGVAALGTAYGGWRIIRTIGMRMTALDPVQGFAAEVSGATVILGASELGIPVSTTHAITAAILGVGVTRSIRAVRWGVTLDIFLSWLLTVPATMMFAYVYLIVLRRLIG